MVTRSRLSKKKQQQLIRQTVMIVFTALALMAAFIFFIMPQFIRLADRFLNGPGEQIENLDHVPPQTPILVAPVSATNSATLAISGVGEAGSKAVLVLNGEKSTEVEIDQSGEFEIELLLTEGENSLLVYGVDQAENESVETRKYQVTLDTLAPMLEILEPQDGSSIELRKNQIVTIKGTTEPKAKVFINDRLVYARADGSFSMSHQLVEGENKIEFRAIDQGGNVSEKELTVFFSY